ncbi:MAG: hypothetical protein JW904_08650 [Spirochaetales bacterium]|nr:hypothetical protein [Spirochaetales bacterium]
MKKIPLQPIAMAGAGILLFGSIMFGLIISFQLRESASIEKEFFHESILDQSSALNRVIFAAAEFYEFNASDKTAPGWLEKKIESCRNLISHASIPPFVARDIYERYITRDPLFLAERIASTDKAYAGSLETLIRIYENISESHSTNGKTQFVLEFDASFAAFYTALKERNSVMTMLEATYHAQLRTNLAWTQNIMDLMLMGQTITILASLAVMFLSSRAQSKQVKVLHGLIPICAKCKKIRDDKGYWSQVETYITRHTEADFSHGICPDCMKEMYPEYIPVNDLLDRT